MGNCISDGPYGNEPNMADGSPGGPAEQTPGTEGGNVLPTQSAFAVAEQRPDDLQTARMSSTATSARLPRVAACDAAGLEKRRAEV